MTVDHSMMKLGKLPPKPTKDQIDFELIGAPLPPPHADWLMGVPIWGMMKNDVLGDCAEAAIGHLIQAMTWAAAKSDANITDAMVVQLYEDAAGYNPADPSTDQGSILTNVIATMVSKGIGGHKILGSASINPKRESSVQSAIAVGGGIYTGFALPLSAQTQDVWDVPAGGPVGDGAPGSWGGHSVIVGAYDVASGLYKCVTWGQPKLLTRAFVNEYMDESYLLVTKDFMNKQGFMPTGFDITFLRACLTAQGVKL